MVRSLWTAPTRWRWQGSEELASWSLLRLVKFYGSVTIHTDELGEMWIDALRLPCAGNIRTTRLLEDIRHHDPHNWSLGKLYTAMNQREPFIQTDFDVVLGRRLPERMHRASVCAERLYSKVPDEWFKKCEAPMNWRKDWSDRNGISFNCGTFGGNDTHSIRRIAAKGFDFAVRNQNTLRSVRSDLAAIACEEWAIAREYDPIEVTCLSSMDPAGSEMLANAKAYWHQPGPTKIEPEVQKKVRDRLEAECPGQVARCKEVASAFANMRK